MTFVRMLMLVVGSASALGAIAAPPQGATAEFGVPNHLRGFAELQGSPQHGRELFRKLGCSGCHAITNSETSFGPNLAEVGRRRTTRQMITSILEPSREVAEGYGNEMPDNFADLLTARDLADLLSYLKTLRGATPR